MENEMEVLRKKVVGLERENKELRRRLGE